MSIFTRVKGFRAKKNAFNLSHQIAQTQDIGQIMPCYLHDGILPGSREVLNATSVVRFQALLAPLQHKVDLYAHFWYVPYRIIDKNFTHFISGDMMRNGDTYDCPVISLSRVAKLLYWIPYSILGDDSRLLNANNWILLLMNPSGLLVYLNYPSYTDDIQNTDYAYNTGTETWPDTPDLIELNIKRLQAYFFIIAQNYVNENFNQKYKYTAESTYVIDLIQELFNFALGDFELLNDPDDSVFMSQVPGARPEEICLAKILSFLYFRGADLNSLNQGYVNPNFSFPHAWKKDYFTSALPFVQLGDEVTIPLTSGSVDISQASLDLEKFSINNPKFTSDGEAILPNGSPIITKNSDGTLGAEASEFEDNDITRISSEDGRLEFSGRMDLDNLESSITINELRAANALQSLKEGFARFGTRFQEWLKGFWNVNSSDRSQQLPEWLGGYKVPVQISEIEQTSATDSTELERSNSPLGTLAGKGLGIGGKRVFKRYFEEPGVVIGLCFLQPKAVYPTTGVDRFLLKTNNLFDYFTPKMEHLGEQSVYSGELYMRSTPDDNLQTFGYQSRYAEYKQIQSKFRGQFANLLDFWHLGRFFENPPVLSSSFIYIDDVTMKRPFAVQNVFDPVSTDISNVMLWFNFDVKYIAPMSRFGTPALLN